MTVRKVTWPLPEIAQIVGPYVVLASLWILVSDQLAATLFPDAATLKLASIIKGWLFIAVTALLLVVLLRRMLGRIEELRREEVQALHQAQANASELAAERAHLRTLLDTLPDLVWLKSPEGVYLTCNRRFEEFFGAREADIVGRTDYDFVDRDLADFFRANDRAAMESGRPRSNEEWVTFASDGHRELLNTTKAPMRSEAGQLIGVLGVARDITHVRELQERFEVAFNASPAAISISRVRDGAFLDVNRNYGDLLGWQRSDLIGRTALDIGLWPRPDARRIWLSELQSSRSLRDYQSEWLHRDGHVVSVSISAEIIRLEEEDYILAFILDISERLRNEAAIRQLQQRLVIAFRAAPVAACITRMTDGRLVDVNQRLLDEYGWQRDELLGRTTLEAGLWGSSEDRLKMVELIRRDGRIVDFDSIGVGRDGSRRRISLSAEKVDMDGVPHLIVYIVDVTDRRKAEEALRAREEIYRSIVTHARDSIVLIDPDTLQFAEFNPAAAAALGYSEEEFQQLRLPDLQASLTPAEVRSRLDDILANGGMLFENEHRCKDGSIQVARISVSAVHIGGRAMISGIWQDITAEKAAAGELEKYRHHLEELVASRTADLEKAKRAAEQASLAKSTFLANMSHEIRTPMNAIIGLTHLAERHAADPGQLERLGKVSDAAHHLMSIINQILDISKIEAGKLTLSPCDFPLAQVLDNAQALVIDRLRSRGLNFEITVDPQLPSFLHGDPLRLGQILLNYLSNAVKFTEHGFIRLSAELLDRQGDQLRVRFSVADSGIGIAADDQPRLFHAFEQADSSATRRFGGTGLGLAIAHHLAHMMDGETGFDSKEGKGSTFWFTARLTAAEQPAPLPVAAPGQAERQIAEGWQHARILLVEDNPVNQEVALDLLRDAGLHADLAADGEQAVAMVAAGNYDLILMDMQMPKMDGIAATLAIRSAGFKQPILAMTANAFGEDRRRCLEAGMNDHIAKPVDPENLYVSLIRWLPTIKLPAPPPPQKDEDGSPETRLAAIPGLDLARGLQAVRGRLPSYLRVLNSFITSHAGSVALLRQHLAQGNRDEALRCAHSLKGAAGTLGIHAVQQAAASCEAALRSGSENEAMLASLEQEHEHIVRTLTDILASINNVS